MSSIIQINSDIDEIGDQIATLIDPETGEIKDDLAFTRLQDRYLASGIDLKEKILSTAVVINNIKAENKGIDEHVKRFEARKKANKQTVEYLMQMITHVFPEGKPIRDDRASVSWTKKKFVDVYDEDSVPTEFMKLKYRENPTVLNKADLEKYLKSGSPVPGCKLKEKHTLSIK